MTLQSDTLASFLDADHVGPRRTVDGVDSLARATARDLSYATIYDTDAEIADSGAGVLITPPAVTDHPSATVIPTEEPREAFVRAADEFFVPDREADIHPTAVIDEGATIGRDCVIGPNVYVGENVTLGDECTIGAGTTLGTDGLLFARHEDGTMTKHIQTGEIVVGDDVEFGANCTVDRSMFEETVIGSGTKIDNLVHIAHDCHIGEDVTIPAGCTFGGHVTLEGMVRLHQDVTLGIYVTVGEGGEVGANSTVLDDVEPYTCVVGSPAEPVGPSRFAD